MISQGIFIEIDNEDCCIFIPVAPNLLVKPSEVRELIPIIEKYISNHTDEEIEQENERRIAEIYHYRNEPLKNKGSDYAGGYVYLFECGGKYKIGVSKNVERRMKELDNRPFKVNLICKVYSDMAYKVEQRIHELMSKFKIEGEWYEFKNTPSVDQFIKLVKNVEQTLKE